MAIHTSIRAWKISWTEGPGGLCSMGVAESDMTELLTLSLSVISKTDHTVLSTLSCI